MATAKSLSTPKIIEVLDGKIRIAHPLIKGNISTALAAPIAAAGTAATVYDNNGFADADQFVIGDVGNRETEAGSINGAVTLGQSLTFTNTLKFAHAIDAPVTKIYERGIKIYGASTDGGSGTLIASVDAITTPIADAVMIQWDKEYTEHVLISTDTAYNYYYAVFTDGTTSSSASAYVPASGLLYTKIEPLIKQSLDIANARLDGKRLTREMFADWANTCQDEIKQFVYQDPGSGRFIQKDWSFEVTVDESIVLVEGEDAYALSGTTSDFKYPNSDKSVFSIQIGSDRPLEKIAIKDWDIERRGVSKTYMNGTGGVGATSITVDSTANFADSGSLTIGSQTLTYTAKTATTFTGIPASGTGSIGTLIADNTAVWQGLSTGKPSKWAIFAGTLYFDRPSSSDFAGMTIKIRYLYSLDRITSVSSGTVIPFVNVFILYFTAMIFFRLGQTDMGQKYMADFRKQVTANALADYIPILDEWHYYSYTDHIFDENSQASVLY